MKKELLIKSQAANYNLGIDTNPGMSSMAFANTQHTTHQNENIIENEMNENIRSFQFIEWFVDSIHIKLQFQSIRPKKKKY